MPGATGEANSSGWDYAIGCTMNAMQHAFDVKAGERKSDLHKVIVVKAPQGLALVPLWRLEKDEATGGQLYRLSLGGRYLSMATEGAKNFAVVTDRRSDALLLLTKREGEAWLLFSPTKKLVVTVRGTDVVFETLAARNDWRSVNTKQLSSLIQAFRIVSKTNEAWPPQTGKVNTSPHTSLRLVPGEDSGVGRKFTITCQINQKHYAIGLEEGGDTTRGYVGLVATELAEGASPLKSPAWKFVANDIQDGGGYRLSIDGLYVAMMPTGRNNLAIATSERERAVIFHPAKEANAWLLKISDDPSTLTIHGTEVCFQVPVSPSRRQPFNTPERSLVALIQTFYIAGKGVWPPAAGEGGTNRRGGIQLEFCIKSNGNEYFLGSEEDELIISDRHQYWNVITEDPFSNRFKLIRNGYGLSVRATDGGFLICLTHYESEFVSCSIISDCGTFSLFLREDESEKTDENTKKFDGGVLVVDGEEMTAHIASMQGTSFIRHYYYWLRFLENKKVLDADSKNRIDFAAQSADRAGQLWRFDNGALQSVADGRYLKAATANDLAWLDLSETREQLLFSPDAICSWDKRNFMITCDAHHHLIKSTQPLPSSLWSLILWRPHPEFSNQLIKFGGKFVLCNVATGEVLTAIDNGSSVGMRPLTYPAAPASLWIYDSKEGTLTNDKFPGFLDSADDKVAVRLLRSGGRRWTDRWGGSTDGYLVRRDGKLKVLSVDHVGPTMQDYSVVRENRQRWHIVPEDAIAEHSHAGGNDEL